MQGSAQEFQEAFVELQKAIDVVWQLVDKYRTSPFVISVQQTDDPIKAFEGARKVHANACKIYRAIQDETGCFAEWMEKFKWDIDASARNAGLRRLPDEILVDILDRAADSFESSLQLSHVCERFGRTLVWSSKYWVGQQRVTSSMSPWAILSMIERSGDRPLNAEIEFNCNIGPRSESARTIVSLAARLDDLIIASCGVDIPHLSYPQQQEHAGSPRSLSCWDCLPHPSLLRNVVECYLDMEHRTMSLKHLLEFLSLADKLEKLSLSEWDLEQDDTDCLRPISLPRLTELQLWYLDSGNVRRVLSPWIAVPPKLQADNLQLMIFLYIKGEDFPQYIPQLADGLLRRGQDRVRFKFFDCDCEQIVNGTYDIANVHRAIRGAA